MNKGHEGETLGEPRADNSSRDPATRAALRTGWRTRKEGQWLSRGQPGLGEVEAAEVVNPVADTRGPDRCAIVYKGSPRFGEFQVVVAETTASCRSVARSPAFRVPRSRALRRWGAARFAHALLVRRLEACGWWKVDSGGAWHELRFLRARPARIHTVRSLITVAREAGQARFVAEQLDPYGNPTPLVVSRPFSAHRFLPVRPSRQAKAALDELVSCMASERWEVAESVGNDWYAISLWRPVSMSSSAPPE
jgi:hypothetical protein